MKKLAAILLLTVLLINLVGYRGWFYFAETQWDNKVQYSLDQDEFNEEDLVMIKAPLNLPYVTDTKEFVRTDGEVKIDGKIYRYVKSKIENGEYVLLCLPDHHKDKLQKAKQDYFHDANDLVNDSKKSTGKTPTLKFSISEYDQQQFQFYIPEQPDKKSVKFSMQAGPLMSSPHISPEQPPDVLA